MLSFLLIVSLFVFFTAVGQAVLSALKVRFGVFWSWFLSPTLGMGITVLCVNAFSKWGFPIRATGPWITGILALASIAVFIWRRPAFPWRQLLPFLAILGCFLLYTGWPIFKFGFNWISYGNDDMANYTLAAERFLNNSYYFLPEQTELEGKDYSQHFWFMHALQQIRPGSEMLLSWTCSITRLNPHQAFMPVIFTLTLLQLFSLGALTLYKGRYRRLALYAMGLLAMSPLFTLGTLYQLIAQVGGISLLICACSLMLREVRFAWNTILATALLIASMGITYPEVAPFVALSIGVYAIRMRYANPAGFPIFIKRILWIAALTFLIMGINTYQFINTLILQSLGSAGLGAMADISQLDGLVLFPWTLVPSFLPMVFGLHAFGVVGNDPLLSICIGLGIVLIIFLVVRVLIGLWRGLPTAVLGVIMLPLGVFLFLKGQDFGLFKLGMFAQPVVAFFLAQGILWIWQRNQRRTSLAVLLLYFAATVPSHYYYVRSSIGDVGGGLSEVVGASEKGVQFKPPADVKFDAIESDITNVVSAKMLAMYTRGVDTRFLSRNYMDNVANIAPLEFLRNPDPEFGDSRSQMLRPLRFLRWMLPDELMTGHVAGYNMMAMRSIDNSWSETSFRHLDYKNPIFVSMQSRYDHFNKFPSLIGEETGWREQGVYAYKPLAEVKNRLIFTHSEKGPHYYSSARFRASFFQREPEPISRSKRYFHGTGRYSMFQVYHPAGDFRLVIDFSRTSLGGSRSQLPRQATVIGEDNYPLNFVGAGSARIFSQPIKPQVFEGLSYLTVDFGEEGQMIFKEKTGLMSLYGLKYNLDDRRLVGFTRDISLVTEEQYRKLKRPSRISRLPDDLYENPGFEYSGIFEDGWLSEQAYLTLGPGKRGDLVTFKGVLPELAEFQNGGVALTMTINGRETEPIMLFPGKFTVNRFVEEDTDITRIEMRFSKSGTYGRFDVRRLTAFIDEIVVRPAGDLLPMLQNTNRVADSFRIQGIDFDGWAAKEAAFRLPPAVGSKVLELQLELPSWATGSAGDLKIAIDGETAFSRSTSPGSYLDIKLPITGPAEKIITITAQNDFKLPGQEKMRSYRVTKMNVRDFAANEQIDGTTVRSLASYQLMGSDEDGWAGRQVRLFVPSTTKGTEASVEFEFPGWAAATSGKFTFTLNGRQIFAEELSRGVYKTVSVPLDSGKDNEIVMTASHSFDLPPPDTRQRSFRILKVEIK
ncbi:MAG TPA: hypothetical protein VHO24_02985 [Opitutaceae bacterium]|nr:hypothetical protein [Opitutaceae bacterium]